MPSIEDLGFQVFRIQTDIPNLRVNIYFTELPVPTLIDAPPDTAPGVGELNSNLNRLGYSLRDIKTIVLTHSHLDHCGSARTIIDASEGEVWAAEGVATWLADYEKESLEEEEFIVSSLETASVPRSLIDQSRERFQYMRRFTRGVTVRRRLMAGDVLPLGSCLLKVVPVPGHTPWCIMLHDENRKIAFAGDFLLGDISPNPVIQRPWTIPAGYLSLRAYASSLARLEEMGLQAAFPGHGEPIANPAERARALLTQMEERRERILEILSRRPMQTIFDVIEELFPQLPPGQMFLAVSEVRSHFELLMDEGLLDEEGGQPARLFSLRS